ncbi:MAG: class I SAM-dependent methyltransferase [Elusimicrobia bacterium]|jgi:SAM-dependent methyltransferase|nr:class I SAM-dependent methyltransferase [Elusimicrobiota bacterium]
MQKENYKVIAEIEKTNWWYRARRDLLNLLLQSIPDRFNKTLDAGAGVGSNLNVLKKYSKTVYGVDISEVALMFCQKKGYDKVINTSIENFRASQKFDLIICTDVFEHIKYDHKAIKNLAKYMARGGVMVLTVPAHEFLWNKNDIFSHHFRRYTMSDIKELLRKSGLSTIKIGYWNQLLLIPVYIYYRLFKQKKLKNNLELVPDVLNNLLYMLLKIENRIFKNVNILPGITIVAVLKKYNYSSYICE